MAKEWHLEYVADAATLQTTLQTLRLAGTKIYGVYPSGAGAFHIKYLGDPIVPLSAPFTGFWGSNGTSYPPRTAPLVNDDFHGAWAGYVGIREDNPTSSSIIAPVYVGQTNPTDGTDEKAFFLERFRFEGQYLGYPFNTTPPLQPVTATFDWNGSSYDTTGVYDIPPGTVITSAKLWFHTLDPGYGPTYVGGWGNPTVDLSWHRVLQPWEYGSSGATWTNRVSTAGNGGPIAWTVPGGLGGAEVAASPTASLTIANVKALGWHSVDLTADVQYFIDNPTLNFGWMVVPKAGTGIDWAIWYGPQAGGKKPQIEISFPAGQYNGPGS